MHPKKLDTGSKDLINNLPEVLIHHILSFLSIKEAASTSILSKKWRYLFAFSPNLDFDDPIRMQPDLPLQEKTEIHTTFMDFVDRILSLQGNFPVNKFSLKCGNGVEDVGITRWLCNVLERGISDLDLRLALGWPHYQFPVKVFSSKSLVKLRVGTRNGLASGGVLVDEVEDVFLPKLKTLYLDRFEIDYENVCPLAKLLSGCPVLEELVLINLWWNHWESCSVSHSTLKRLKISFEEVPWDNPNQSVTFDTPALVYFQYSDIVARNYAKVNFESLIETRLDLKVGYEQVVVENVMGFPPDIDYVRAGDATNLFLGIRNVEILYLSASTVEVLTFCCNAIPIFNNLAHLTIESSPTVGWESLPDLLKKCPNLKTLIFQGLLHKATDTCGDLCRCKSAENSPTCLSSSPVKVLKILKFNTTNDNEIEIEQMKYFLETMPNLDQVILYYDTSKDEDVIKVSKQLEMLPKVASPKCKIQVISDNLNLSVNIPSSISIKWDPLL